MITFSTSDIHVEGVIDRILSYVSDLDFDELILVGDRTINPKGKNILREAKQQAVLQDRIFAEVEDEYWEGKHRDYLIEQWLEIREPTRKLHQTAERYVEECGERFRWCDTGGNDHHKIRREKKAAEAYRENTKNYPAGSSLTEILDSPAFRKIKDVECTFKGVTLDIRIPYIGDADQTTLDHYLASIRAELENDSNPEQIVILGHLNPDIRLRYEPRAIWYEQVYKLARGKSATVLHLFGHAHHTPPPCFYRDVTEYRKTLANQPRSEIDPALIADVKLVPLGMDSRRGTQRVVRLNYDDPMDREIIEFPLVSLDDQIIRTGKF